MQKEQTIMTIQRNGKNSSLGIYKVLETEKGFYSIALKEKEGHFSYTFLFFREKTVGYGWGEEGVSTVLLKLI